MFTVTELNIYPVKSLGGYSVNEAAVVGTGFMYDRQWMLIDSENKWMTQREFPGMAILNATVGENGLHIQHKHQKDVSLTLPLVPELQQFKQVEVWSDRCKAQIVSVTADEWFSDILKQKCQLVYMPVTTNRRVDGRYAQNKEITTFTDGYPFMMLGEASFSDLNKRLEQPLPMNRFRPNIVFTGGEPYEEDLFEHFAIGAVEFMGVKLCARCVMTTIDQQTLATAKEPLKTLAGYRSKNNKIYFGQNLLHKGEGVVRTGDQIQIIKKKQVGAKTVTG